MKTTIIIFSIVIVAIIATSAEVTTTPAIDTPLWGDNGHEIVASIAQSFLTSAAADQASNILSGQSLISVSIWADSVRRTPQYAWSAPLHFINTPSWACNFARSRDCSDQMCVAGAITNYTNRLVATHSTAYDRNEALKFITHFVGDIHQPLHVGFTDDKGGNTLTGHFEGTKANLHAIWDNNLIHVRLQDFSGSYDSYAAYLVQQINGPWQSQAQQWATCASYECSDEWANESAALACSNAYVEADGQTKIVSGFDLEADYYTANVNVIDVQLARGGVRLAALLNKALGGGEAATDVIEAVVLELPSNTA